jgi:thiol:disulfide interchange protein DsbD
VHHLVPSAATVASGDAVRFRPVQSSAELDELLRAPGRPVMLDFYADWCVSCKEMERFTFADPAVRARLDRMLLLRADVTANNDDDKALLKRFGLFGPPGIIFFDAAGKERAAPRVVGFMAAEPFAAALDEALR